VTLLRENDYVLLSNGVRYSIIRTADIVAIEADGNYVIVDFLGGKMCIRRTLNHCEEKLDPSIFLRTGRSCLANLTHVKRVSMASPRQFMFTMANDKEIIVSRKQSLWLRREKFF
jgi:two-component system LytT family response regulator